MSDETTVTERDIVSELADPEVERCLAELEKRPKMRDQARWLKRSIQRHDIVIGIWSPGADGQAWDYAIIKGADTVFSLLFVAQSAGGGWRARHGFTTVVVPCSGGIEEARAMQLAFVKDGAAADVAKMVEELVSPEDQAAFLKLHSLAHIH